jgi:hypothetical protein
LRLDPRDEAAPSRWWSTCLRRLPGRLCFCPVRLCRCEPLRPHPRRDPSRAGPAAAGEPLDLAGGFLGAHRFAASARGRHRARRWPSPCPLGSRHRSRRRHGNDSAPCPVLATCGTSRDGGAHGHHNVACLCHEGRVLPYEYQLRLEAECSKCTDFVPKYHLRVA